MICDDMMKMFLKINLSYLIRIDISDIIGENFCKILLDNINNINELVLFPKSIGYLEDITITLADEDQIVLEAKLDLPINFLYDACLSFQDIYDSVYEKEIISNNNNFYKDLNIKNDYIKTKEVK